MDPAPEKVVTLTCTGGAVAETEEEILARTQRYEMKKRELDGYVEEYTEEWYRMKYPGFPDEYYPLFVQASEISQNINILISANSK